MQARYYDPVIGRFYSNDPVGWTPQNPVMSFNRYLYVNNNPYKYTDPNGEFLHIAVGAGIGALGGFASSLLNGGDFEQVVASTIAGGIIGGGVAATGGTSLLAIGGAGALSDASSQIIVNFEADNVDTSSVEAFAESAGTEFVDAVSEIDAGEVIASGVLNTFGGVVQKGAEVLKFSDNAVAGIAETTNVLTSARKDELVD